MVPRHWFNLERLSAMTSLPYLWDGFNMVPRRPEACRDEFEIGETYLLAPEQSRSEKSEGHYFAELRTAHLNLPEDKAREYPTVDHLRARALIKCGYYDEKSIACDSKEVAQRVATFAATSNEYAVVKVSGDVVKVFTAKSQSRKAMGHKEFQKSKDDVLNLVKSLIGVDRETLSREAMNDG